MFEKVVVCKSSKKLTDLDSLQRFNKKAKLCKKHAFVQKTKNIIFSGNSKHFRLANISWQIRFFFFLTFWSFLQVVFYFPKQLKLVFESSQLCFASWERCHFCWFFKRFHIWGLVLKNTVVPFVLFRCIYKMEEKSLSDWVHFFTFTCQLHNAFGKLHTFQPSKSFRTKL